ncbi:Cytochrome c553 class I [Candidatus Nasuia deltocephalinicola]|uniref:Cytochrome c553 class I n=1 Tax=Candidatus Nasuia deltocephalincola TaxID=1160784 RepID=A0A0S2UP56_9PROT|nr:Cytochrome c553 class I [Candidatus Nasuia deltocephalinicola]
MFIKGKNLIKLHNCFFCHKINNKLNKKNYFPKIKSQYTNYLIWCLKQYQINYNRKNFIMYSQIQNISLLDIKKIIFFINKKF